MTVFASEGSVSKAVLETLNGENSLDKTQVHELLGRQSNCDYPQQILDGLRVAEPLYTAVIEKVKTTGTGQTQLPAATRHYFNAENLLPGYGSQLFVNDIDDPTTVLLAGPTENIIRSHQATEPKYTGDISLGKFMYTSDVTLKVNFKASIGITSGAHRLGQGHPVPVFRYSGDVSENIVRVDVALVIVRDGVEIGQYVVSVDFFKENIENMDVYSVYASKMIDIRMPESIVNGSPAQLGFYLRVSRSPWIATYNGVSDKAAFIKQSSGNGSSVDASNYLEVIEMGPLVIEEAH